MNYFPLILYAIVIKLFIHFFEKVRGISYVKKKLNVFFRSLKKIIFFFQIKQYAN